MRQSERDIRRKLTVPRYAEEFGNVSLARRRFGISRQCFYVWKRAYEKDGEPGLVNKKLCPHNVALRTPPAIEANILHLRRICHFGPRRLAWYLERYHGIAVSASGVYRVLTRNGLGRLPANCRTRSIVSKRCEKQMPGHHVQVDVKFLKFVDPAGRAVQRYQFTAVDDATRIRALKVYDRHNQENAIDFIDHVVSSFPFRIHTVRTRQRPRVLGQVPLARGGPGHAPYLHQAQEPEPKRQGGAFASHR